MLPSLFFLISLFATGAQVVLSRNSDDKFQFKIEAVKQCEPVFLDFQGTKQRNDGLPITNLTILPIGQRAFSIPLGQVNITDEGINVTFIPLAEGATFLASLDDETGENVAKLSDLVRIQASTTGRTDCIQDRNLPRIFTLVTQDGNGVTQPRQCESFRVSYDSGLTSAPQVRLYQPNEESKALNRTGDDEISTATYTMRESRGKQVVLLYKGDAGLMEASELITVGGDSESTKDCFGRGGNGNNRGNRDSDGLNQKTIMGLAIGGAIVSVIAIALISYLFWERRSRRRVSIHFDPSMMEKRSLPPSEPSQSRPQTWNSVRDRFVQNPPYTATIADTDQSHTTMSSWAQVVPSDYHEHHRAMNRGSTTVPAIRHSPASSLQSFHDIEGILNSQEQRVRAELDSPLPSPLSMMESPSAPTVAYRGLPARAQLQESSSLRAPSPPGSIRPASPPISLDEVAVATDPFDSPRELPNPHIGNRASSGLLQPPPPLAVGRNRSHFSVATESSFGGFDTDRISGVPDSVVSNTDRVGLPSRARPLPSANGLGRGNGEAR